MSARFLSPDRSAERRPNPPPLAAAALLEVADGLHSWRGASGRQYAHGVFSLIECPPLPRAAYVLVRREADGRRRALHIASGQSDAPTLNLARIRQRGAMLGANEVHVHALATTDEERHLIVCDLRAGQFGALAEEPARAVCA